MKLQLLKDTFKYLLELLDAKDRLSIVLFNGTATRLTSLLKMTEANKTKTLTALNLVQASGGTDIAAGVTMALNILKQRRYTNSVTSVLLLSDGLDGGADQKIKSSLQHCNLKDTFTLNTFGYGADHDPKLMSSIAQLKEGNFYFVEKLDTVDECFIDCLGGLISVVGQDVQVSVKPEPSEMFPNIQITKGYGMEGIWKKYNDIHYTTLSQLVSGKRKDYLLEIQIPKTSKELPDTMRNLKIASATVSLKTLHGATVLKVVDLITSFCNEVEELKDPEFDKDVMFHYYRVRSAEIMEQARLLSDQRKYDEAKKILTNFKEDITNSKVKDDEAIKNLIKDLDLAISHVKPDIYEYSGRHYMHQNINAQMNQQSNLGGNNNYQNRTQMCMVQQQQVRKGNMGGMGGM
jgi:hypothetical protein